LTITCALSPAQASFVQQCASSSTVKASTAGSGVNTGGNTGNTGNTGGNTGNTAGTPVVTTGYVSGSPGSGTPQATTSAASSLYLQSSGIVLLLICLSLLF